MASHQEQLDVLNAQLNELEKVLEVELAKQTDEEDDWDGDATDS
jgi:hypothetical protein